MQIRICPQRLALAVAQAGRPYSQIDKRAKKKEGWFAVNATRVRQGRTVTPMTAHRIAKALGCNVTELLVLDTDSRVEREMRSEAMGGRA